MRESTSTIGNTATESTSGRMGANMRDTGRMENNTERASTSKQMDRRDVESGRTASALSGLTNSNEDRFMIITTIEDEESYDS